jgi:hypothetical protein
MPVSVDAACAGHKRASSPPPRSSGTVPRFTTRTSRLASSPPTVCRNWHRHAIMMQWWVDGHWHPTGSGPADESTSATLQVTGRRPSLDTGTGSPRRPSSFRPACHGVCHGHGGTTGPGPGARQPWAGHFAGTERTVPGTEALRAFLGP